ncbi:RNA-directed DNA polymerase from mobile element jockey [Trichonephila clavipes]|nr:RNA-directed DNA polymerase from mobile element jockey [Trichonephila clavipes]
MLAKPNQDRTYPQGYRPISLINATAKIFERIILTRIKSHCKAIDCIPPEQCGFWEGHSMLHQLIRVTNIINEGFAHKFYTVGVFLDVKRAFDKMWHDGLTYKLIKLQFPDYLIKIIHNFLHNRTFRVRVNNSYSNTGSCLSGVPQGSVLSPYWYNIYTHDFPQHSTVSTCLFADDSAVLSQGVQMKYTIKTVQHFLDKLETWLTHWRIAINVDKSQAIVFRKWGVIDPPFQLTLFDDNIQWVPVVKYLGLHIDSRLTFKKHIDYLSEKFWGRISLAISLVGRRSPLSLENKVILYKQILRPVITYGSPVWGVAAATHMKKIQGKSEHFESVPSDIENLVKSIKTLTIPVPSNTEAYNLFFQSLEKAFKTKNVEDKFKAEILLNMLGEKVGNLMIYVKQEELGNSEKIKQLVLKQFQPTPRVLLKQFRRSQKLPNENYVQFASRIEAMFDYDCKLRNVSEFNELCQLIVPIR